MKRFFHIVAILLFALIVAGLYEVYYMRGGQLSWTNPVESFISEKGGWDSILGFQGLGKSTEKGGTSPPVDENEKDVPNPKEVEDNKKDRGAGLLAEYSTGSLDAIQFKKLGLNDNGEFTYSVLEYCAHSADLCQDAYEDNILDETVTLMWSDAPAIRKPFIGDLAGADAFVRAGESCVDDEKLDAYHDAVYQAGLPQNLEDIQKIGEEIGIDTMTECVQGLSAEIFITQQMRLANSLFGVTKIPSYVLIDNTSKERVLVPGLYSLKEIGEVMTEEFDFSELE